MLQVTISALAALAALVLGHPQAAQAALDSGAAVVPTICRYLAALALQQDSRLTSACAHLVQSICSSSPDALDSSEHSRLAKALTPHLLAAVPKLQHQGPSFNGGSGASAGDSPPPQQQSRTAARGGAAGAGPSSLRHASTAAGLSMLSPDWLHALHEVMHAVWLLAATGGLHVSRQFGSLQALAALAGILQACTPGGPLGGDAVAAEHCLGAASVLLAAVPSNRQQFASAGAVTAILSLLSPPQQRGTAAAAAATTADAQSLGCECLALMCSAGGGCDTFVRARGLQAVVSLLAQRSSAASAFASGGGSAADGAGDDAAAGPAVEELLHVVTQVAADRVHSELVAEPSTSRVLTQVLRAGLTDGGDGGSGGGCRATAAVAQVLRSLAQHAGRCETAVAANRDLVTLMLGLVDRAVEGTAASQDEALTLRQVALLHGGLCCAEALCCMALRSNGGSGGGTAGGTSASGLAVQQLLQQPVNVRSLCRLLAHSVPVLQAVWEGGGSSGGNVGAACTAYLNSQAVHDSLESAVLALVQQLCCWAEQPAACQQLRGSSGLLAALRHILAWPHVAWHAKQCLHLLGLLDSEYVPFVRYSPELLAQVLAQQGIAPAALLARGVDAHLLLSAINDHYMRYTLHLDDVAILKVKRLQAAHALFAAIDGVDGRIDGRVSRQQLVSHLTGVSGLRPAAAEDVARRVYEELGAGDGEPLCFKQLAVVYPWLSSELDAVGGAAAKRQRVG